MKKGLISFGIIAGSFFVGYVIGEITIEEVEPPVEKTAYELLQEIPYRINIK